MELGIIVAIVGSAIAMIGVMLSLFLWNRSESNADRRDIVNLIRAIQDEMKDFHGRMCRIEESREGKK